MNVKIIVFFPKSTSVRLQKLFLGPRSFKMAMYKPGTICCVRSSPGDWMVIGTQHDGLVNKYLVQSRLTGEIKSKFNFEVFEKFTSTYQEVNDFFESVTGIGLDENLDFLDEDLDEVELDTVNSVIETLTESAKGTETVREETGKPAPQQAKRFKSASVEDITKLRSQNTEKTTDSSTKWAVGLLKAWLSENGYVSQAFEDMDTSTLDQVLQQFYACLQSRKGGAYSKSALVGIRSGINRHLTAPPFSRLLNLMKDRDFMVSNQVLSGLIKGLKRDGKDISKNKEPISEPDYIKLYESGVFSTDKPDTLQNKVLYELISQFGRRGREGLQTLKKDSFTVKTDVRGRRYLTMTYNEANKTHHGVDSREKAKQPSMYETKDEFCPLASYEKYLSKLNPNCDRLFQRPTRKFIGPDSEMWYENSPLGVHKINNFMARLSDSANLSQRYTNHCIRVFVSTTLHHKGFTNQAIMTVTGHRNEQSLNSYIKTHDDEKHELSNALTYKSKSVNPSLPPVSGSYSAVVPLSVEEHPTPVSPQDQQVQLQVANSNSTSVSNMTMSTGREFNIFSGAVHAGTINVNVFHGNSSAQ